MSKLALYEPMSELAAGLLAGQTSTGGGTWSNSTLTNGTPKPLSVDATPSFYDANTGNTSGVGVQSWTPPGANYGVGFWASITSTTPNGCAAAIVRYTTSGVGAFYAGGAFTNGNTWAILKLGSSGFTTLATVSHTFSAAEEHYCSLEVSGVGATVTLNLYVDGTLTVTATDSSSPIVGAGQAGAFIQSLGGASSISTGSHLLQIQSDAQAGTLSGPASGFKNTTSTTFTMVLEVPAIRATTATLSDGGNGGTFSPTSLSFAGGTSAGPGATTATFTYTPASGFTGLTSISASVTTPNTTFTSNPIAYAVSANTYSLAGPTTGVINQPSSVFTLTPGGLIAGDTISLSDGGGGGTFIPTSLTFTGSSAAQTFTYTPASVGAKSLAVTSGNSFTITGSPKTYTVTLGYALTGPTSGAVGIASTPFTLTPGATVPTDVVTLSDGGAGGAFTPTSLTFTSSAAAQTFTYRPTAVGVPTLTLTSSHSYTISGSPSSYTSLALATHYTFSGSSQGTAGQSSGTITLTPNGFVTGDTVTFGDGGMGGVFAPTSLSFASTALAQTFAYTPLGTVNGNVFLTGSSSAGKTFTPPQWTYTVFAGISYFSTLYNLPSGFVTSARVVAWTTSSASVPGPVMNAAIGTIFETVVGGGLSNYSTVALYPVSSLPVGTFPWFHWTVAGQNFDDTTPVAATVIANTVQIGGQPATLDVNSLLITSTGSYAAGQDPATLVLGASASTFNVPGTVGGLIATSGGSIPINQPLSNFPFYMASSTDGLSPVTGATVTAKRSLNGASFAPCANAPTEIGLGWYEINLNASDLNAAFVSLEFIAAGANAALVSIATQAN